MTIRDSRVISGPELAASDDEDHLAAAAPVGESDACRVASARVALVQGLVPEYRVQFMEDLRKLLGGAFTVAAGTEHFEKSVVPTCTAGVVDLDLTNRFLLGRRLLFQHGYRLALQQAEVVVLELNPRIITTWLALLELRISGRRAILWGHFAGRRQDEPEPRLLRRLQVRLAHGVIAYTAEEAGKFERRFPRLEVSAAPNATEPADAIETSRIVASDLSQRTDLIYVGRFTAGKRPDLLVQGFIQALETGTIPERARLVLVGEGPMKAGVRELIASHGLASRILLPSSTFDSAALDEHYSTAVASVCGGYVGLNITQSLRRGVPMIFPRIANHAPEASIGLAGATAFPFDPNSVAGFTSELARVWALAESNPFPYGAIAESFGERYTTEIMASGFARAVEAQLSDNR
jgi:glycosyltransferase involved in cell wall biosynthesis